MKTFAYWEEEYLDLLHYVMDLGQERPDRTDVGTSKFVNGCTLTFDLRNDAFPIKESRKISPRIAFEETMFFLRGQTDSKILEEKGIMIWHGNTTRKELDKRGLNYLPEGSIGKSYSHQWRNFGGTDTVPGTDQVLEMLENMKRDPNSRRHLISAWNPNQMEPDKRTDDELYENYLNYYNQICK